MKYLTVKDPKSSNYMIYLNPRQGLCLELSYPLTMSEGEDWEVMLFSDFMVEERKKTEKGSKLFYFIQPFDMKDWAKISNVYLAEIAITWKKGESGNFRDSPEFEKRVISVVLQASNREQRDILTVVNPNYYNVRMYPHQTLEVVLYDENNTQPEYKADHTSGADTTGSGQKWCLAVEKINEKLVVQKRVKGRFVNVDDQCYALNRTTCDLPANPRLKGDSPFYPHKPIWNGPYKAQHVYFRLKRDALDKVIDLRNGVYASSNIVFHEDKINSQDFGVDITVAVKGAKKPLIRRMDRQPRKNKMLLGTTESVKSTLLYLEKLSKGERHEGHYLIVNPKMNDTIEFVDGEDNSYIVEIAPPCVFDCKLSSDLIWETSVEPTFMFTPRHDTQQKVSCVELDHRKFEGKVAQRFLVSPIGGHSLKKNQKFSFFGIVTFSCRGHPDLMRRVACYMLDQSKKKTPCTSITYGGGTGSRSYTVPKPAEKTYFKVRIREAKGDLDCIGSFVKFSSIKNACTDTTTKKEGKGKKKVNHPYNQGWGYG